jgi:hypothetical protein
VVAAASLEVGLPPFGLQQHHPYLLLLLSLLLLLQQQRSVVFVHLCYVRGRKVVPKKKFVKIKKSQHNKSSSRCT